MRERSPRSRAPASSGTLLHFELNPGVTVKRTELSDGSQLYETDRGAIRVTHLGRGYTSHVCTGNLTVPIAQAATDDGDALLGHFDRCTFFVDCYDVRHLETAFREHMTMWFKQNRRRKIFGHMLVRSKVIELAASVANLLAGTQFVKVYSSIDGWQQACQQDVPEFRRTPLAWRPVAQASP